MPLEKRCIRFIDNFSGGTRGALSTEFFLQVLGLLPSTQSTLLPLQASSDMQCSVHAFCKGCMQIALLVSPDRQYPDVSLLLLQAGYAVIFLNRKHSIQPFTKGLPSGHIMETLTQVLDTPESSAQPSGAQANGHANGHSSPESSGGSGSTGAKKRRKGSSQNNGRAIVKQAVARAASVRKQGVLMHVTFETLFEYLKVCPLLRYQTGQGRMHACSPIQDLAREQATPEMESSKGNACSHEHSTACLRCSIWRSLHMNCAAVGSAPPST